MACTAPRRRPGDLSAKQGGEPAPAVVDTGAHETPLAAPRLANASHRIGSPPLKSRAKPVSPPVAPGSLNPRAPSTEHHLTCGVVRARAYRDEDGSKHGDGDGDGGAEGQAVVEKSRSDPEPT
ncbi:hypothetical protein ZWY2020_038993 [Hordeum vulgare]|nr:hypothetical protein ZWY2020_038993 [Hordeum vulgare]